MLGRPPSRSGGGGLEVAGMQLCATFVRCNGTTTREFVTNEPATSIHKIPQAARQAVSLHAARRSATYCRARWRDRPPLIKFPKSHVSLERVGSARRQLPHLRPNLRIPETAYVGLLVRACIYFLPRGNRRVYGMYSALKTRNEHGFLQPNVSSPLSHHALNM